MIKIKTENKGSTMLIRHTFILITGLMVFSHGLWAIPPKKEAQPKSVGTVTQKVPTKLLMRSIYKSYIDILPYVVNDESFYAEGAEQKIKTYLINLSLAFNQATHNTKLSGSNFSPSVKVMKDHIKDTIEAFDSQNKVFAQARLRVTTHLCSSCHNQLPSQKKLSLTSTIQKMRRSDFKTDYEYAEFLYITRQFNKASQYYIRYIDHELSRRDENMKQGHMGMIKEQDQNNLIYKAFKKLALIDLHALGNTRKFANRIKPYVKSKKLSPFVSDELKAWSNELEEMKKKKWSIPANDLALRKFIDGELKAKLDKQDMSQYSSISLRLLTASGVLLKYLARHRKSTHAPEILLWVSKAERQLYRSFFFSLADVYLKECITSFPTSPFAKSCFKEYEKNIVFGYTGSAGTHIPDDEKAELEALKGMIK